MMPVEVPKIGSRVRVTTRDKEYYVYATKEWRDTTMEGIVEKSVFKDPFYFALRTGNEFYPVSEFNAKSERLVKIEYITGSATQISTETKAWKIQSKGKVYLVTRIAGKFNCTCKGFEFRRDCKHIGAVGKK
jgi:hypothetical protein